MEQVISAGLFALACNLDTLLLALSFGLRGMPLHWREGAILAGVTTWITAVSLGVGARAGELIPPSVARALGGLVLTGLGLWCLLEWLGTRSRAEEPPVQDKQGGTAWLALAAALGVNNAGTGMAAGVSGISILWGSGANFFFTLLFLPLGCWMGAGWGPDS